MIAHSSSRSVFFVPSRLRVKNTLAITNAQSRQNARRTPAFTLIEVLVVVAIIALLIAILVPALSASRRATRVSLCASGLRQVGVAIHSYASDHAGWIPYGPKAPPPSATNFYPMIGIVTSLLSLQDGKPVGLGLLLQKHLARQKTVLFCPDRDQPADVEAALKGVGKAQVQGSYYYRHASETRRSGKPPSSPRMKIDQLGYNRSHKAPIRCLAVDTQFLTPPSMAMFNLYPQTHHQRRLVNALYTDGHVSARQNFDERFTVDNFETAQQSTGANDGTLLRILSVLESLDGG